MSQAIFYIMLLFPFNKLSLLPIIFGTGRAIRHVNDYAAVLLVDSRYASNLSNQSSLHPTDKLPLWIKERLVSATESYGEVHKLLHQFFQFNKQRAQLEV